jgi:hypothetical protein
MGMKLRGPRAVACAVLVASGCGTIPPALSSATSSPHAAGTQAAFTQAASTQAASPRQRAEADATAILASFVPPAGATKLASAPGADGGALGHTQTGPDTPDLVDAAAWWQVPGQAPQAVLSWEASHVPSRFTLTGSGVSPRTVVDTWTLPPVPGVLDTRWLIVTAVSDGAGGTDLRAEGQVTYTPARPSGSYIAVAAVHSVLVTAVPGPNDRTAPPAPLLVTDPAKVRDLVALVNGLPLFPPGTYSCPMDDGKGVRLTFLSTRGGGKAANGPVIEAAVLAVAFAKANGCGGVQLTIAGTQTSLGWGSTAAEQALAITGMSWQPFV